MDGMQTRPTSDRLRETLFNILAPIISGKSFADVCAGSGAVGIEALSRGASDITFIELSRKAATIIRKNLEHCEIRENVKVFEKDAIAAFKKFAEQKKKFDIIFIDPPYDSFLYSELLDKIAFDKLLSDDGIVIAEHRSGAMITPSHGKLRPYREVVQGDSCLTFFSYE